MIETEPYGVVETGALKGVDPTTTFHESKQSARTYVMSRIHLFERFDLARVIARITVTYERKLDEVGDGSSE